MLWQAWGSGWLRLRTGDYVNFRPMADTRKAYWQGLNMDKTKGSQFLRFCIPIIEVLKDLGGSGQPAEVTDAVLEKLQISEEEQVQTTTNGISRVRNQVAWARFYLAKAGWIDSSRRGVWALTEQGRVATPSQKDVSKLLKDTRANLTIKEEKSLEENDETDTVPPTDQASGIESRSSLLNVLKSLTPKGFEKVSQRLLRESGFERVVVTGQPSDGGIDGHGILQVNPFVSFTVSFQCKRYSGTVSPSQVRDFRGAMIGRAEKGIMITTGTFTTEAKKEARRDGAPPIELVDGEQLVKMFERLELGMKPKTIYEVDEAFFDEYR
jgi:restriction system protein